MGSAPWELLLLLVPVFDPPEEPEAVEFLLDAARVPDATELPEFLLVAALLACLPDMVNNLL